MEQKSLNFLILGFVTLILGLVLVGTVASNVLASTDKTVVDNEVIDLTNAKTGALQVNESDPDSNITLVFAPSGWQLNDATSCPISTFVYGNSTVDYTLNTDYQIFLSSGILHVKNTSVTQDGGNSTLADYRYCGDDYLNSAFGRSITNLVPGFFALALLGVSLFLFYSVAKIEGIFSV